MENRPESVTVLAVLSFVFGGMGLLSLPLAYSALYSMEGLTGIRSPMLVVLERDPLIRTWYYGSLAVGTLLALVLLAVGAGLLKLRPWARKLGLVYGAIGLVVAAAGLVFNVVVLTPALLKEADSIVGPGSVGAMGGAVGGAVGGVFGLLFPAAILYLLTRPATRDAFRAKVGGGAS